MSVSSNCCKASNPCCTHRQGRSHLSDTSHKLNHNQQFLVHITSNILWSSCPTSHSHISCLSNICYAANSYPPPLCRHHSKPPVINRRRRISHCTVVSTNSVSHSCFVSELTYTNLGLSATDGRRRTTPSTVPRFVSAQESSQIPPDPPSAWPAWIGLALPFQLNLRLRCIARGNSLSACRVHLRPGGGLLLRRALLHDNTARDQPHHRPLLHANNQEPDEPSLPHQRQGHSNQWCTRAQLPSQPWIGEAQHSGSLYSAKGPCLPDLPQCFRHGDVGDPSRSSGEALRSLLEHHHAWINAGQASYSTSGSDAGQW